MDDKPGARQILFQIPHYPTLAFLDYMILSTMMFLINYETLVDPYLRDVRKFTLEFSGMKAGDKVIDVCCGTGAQVLEYATHGIIATGIDISPNMLKIATRNKVRHNAVNVSFQLADATELPFPNGYFDYASISLGLHENRKPTRYKIISEMKRVVKQNGALILIDFQVTLPRNVWGMSVRAIEFLAGWANYQSFKDYLANGGIEDILKNHGLQEECSIIFKSGLLVATKAVNG
jgi:ubiquinone/menaquinone biosynthesis C-methylase UbiE